VFHPRGLLGHLYWWSVSPFHAVVFGGMARNIVRAAERAGPSPRGHEAAASGVPDPGEDPGVRAGSRRPPGRS
jgi:hypothetical protein